MASIFELTAQWLKCRAQCFLLLFYAQMLSENDGNSQKTEHTRGNILNLRHPPVMRTEPFSGGDTIWGLSPARQEPWTVNTHFLPQIADPLFLWRTEKPIPLVLDKPLGNDCCYEGLGERNARKVVQPCDFFTFTIDCFLSLLCHFGRWFVILLISCK